jgi:hypothetical protein
MFVKSTHDIPFWDTVVFLGFTRLNTAVAKLTGGLKAVTYFPRRLHETGAEAALEISQ